MQVPKDIDLIIYRFAHRDLMEQLNNEYHKIVHICTCEDAVCTGFIRVISQKNANIVFTRNDFAFGYNYRNLKVNTYIRFIHDKYNRRLYTLPFNY